MTALVTPAEISRALGQLGRHGDVEHQPDAISGNCPRCGDICPDWISAVRALRAAGWHVAVCPPHQPHRPSWTCPPCGEPWPCWQARVMLGDRYDDAELRTGLTTLMRTRMGQAAVELRVPADELELRFVRWV